MTARSSEPRNSWPCCAVSLLKLSVMRTLIGVPAGIVTRDRRCACTSDGKVKRRMATARVRENRIDGIPRSSRNEMTRAEQIVSQRASYSRVQAEYKPDLGHVSVAVS